MRPIIDRYLFRQLLGPAVLATLALSMVAMLSEALSLIGLLLNERQSPWLFAKVVLLAMPQMVILVLPVAVIVAAVISLNRLQREHEIAICFAAGMSRWRVASPAIRLASLAALVSLAITLWIQPLCFRAMRDTLHQVRTDLVSTLIRPGRFTHPAPGVTIYAQAIDESGVIRNLFIDRRLESGRDTTITAQAAVLLRRSGAPMLVLRHGANHEYGVDRALTFLSFDIYVLDLRALLPDQPAMRYKLSDGYLHELFLPASPQGQSERRAALAEAHARLAAPLYNLAFAFLALVAVVGGAFSRLGYGPRIACAGMVAVVTRALGFAVQATAGTAPPVLNSLQYALPLVVCAACAWLLLRARPMLPVLGAGPKSAPRGAIAVLAG